MILKMKIDCLGNFHGTPPVVGDCMSDMLTLEYTWHFHLAEGGGLMLASRASIHRDTVA